MAINLIKINEFPESVDTKNWMVVADSNGISYKISIENVKAELGIGALMQYRGSVVPSSDVQPEGDFFVTATQAGTYTNYGGVVVPANSFAVISRVGGTYTSSITGLDTNAVLKTDIIDDLTTGGAEKVLSAEQGVVLNTKLEKLGYNTIPPLTEFATELKGSSISDLALWIPNSIYGDDNGILRSGVGFSASVKYYPIPKGEYDFKVFLQMDSGTTGLCLYDENYVFIKCVKSYREWVEFNTDGAAYYTISHYTSYSTPSISLLNIDDINVYENPVFIPSFKESKFVNIEDISDTIDAEGNLPQSQKGVVSAIKEISLTKSESGYSVIQSLTEFATELKESSISDPAIWIPDKIYRDTTGELQNGVGFSASVKFYPIPKGNYDFKVYLQMDNGTTGLCLYDENYVFIKCVKSYREWVEFNTENASYYTMSKWTAYSTPSISLQNVDKINVFDEPLFIPSYKEGQFGKTIVLNRFSEVSGQNPETCDVGKFRLVRNTDTPSGNVLKDYDVQFQNYSVLNKTRGSVRVQINQPLYDVDEYGGLYSVVGRNVMFSPAVGTDFTVLVNLPQVNDLLWIFVLGNGELLLIDKTIRGVTPDLDVIGGIYVSSSGRTVWTKTLTYRNRYIELKPQWGFEQVGAVLYLSEYGNSSATATANDPSWTGGVKADANQIWKSTNYGGAWTKLVKLTELTDLYPNDGNLHIHAIHYDKYWNRLWVTTGDGNGKVKSNKKLAWTDNGIDWGGIDLSGYYANDPANPANTPYDNLQGLSMISTNEALLIGSDCWNNSIFRVNKRDRNKVFLEDAYLCSSIVNDIVYFTGRMSRYSDSPIFIGLGYGDSQTTPAKNNRPPKILASWDGVSFTEIWADLDLVTGMADAWLRVWKIKGKYYVHAFYSSTNTKYLIEFNI